MTAIVWHAEGSRKYEAGLDRGVLYVGSDTGVPWNGLTSVDENPSNTTTPIYFNGRKTNDLVVLGDFSGVLRAFTYPDEFLVCEGQVMDQVGVYLGDQPVSRFGITYRTLIGEGSKDIGEHYKIHILWNLTAVPAVKSRQTLALDVAPSEFEWTLTAVPESVPGYRDTAHMILDTREMDPLMLKDLEETLYGTDISEPRLPSLRALLTFIQKWDRFIITDNGDGTFTATSQEAGVIVDIGNDQYTITIDTIVDIDADSYTISSSDKNEEDF